MLADRFTFDDFIKYPRLPWNWDYAHKYKGFDIQYVFQHPDLNWHWYNLTNFVLLEGRFDFIITNLHYDWDWMDVTLHCIKEGVVDILIQPELPFNYLTVSMNITTIEDVKKYIDKPLDFYCLSHKLTSFALKDVMDLKDKNWDLESLTQVSTCPFPLEQIVEYPELTWDWPNIHLYKQFDPKHVVNHLNLQWSIEAWQLASVYAIKTMGFAFMRDNVQYPWDWNTITLEFVTSFTDVEDNLDLPWNFDILSTKPIKIQQIVNHFKSLNWTKISSNPSISAGDIFLYPHLPWEWEHLWCFENFQFTKMNDRDADYIANRKASTIQHSWKESISNPKYYLCRKRLEHEFNELSSEMQ
jgi:hypothetical protein